MNKLEFYLNNGGKYSFIPRREKLSKSIFISTSTKYFDPIRGQRVIEDFLDNMVLGEQLGFDGLLVLEAARWSKCRDRSVDRHDKRLGGKDQKHQGRGGGSYHEHLPFSHEICGGGCCAGLFVSRTLLLRYAGRYRTKLSRAGYRSYACT